MGNLSLADFRDNIKFLAQNSSKATDDRLDKNFNAAYLHLAQPHIYQHRILRTTVAFPLVLDQVVYDLEEVTVSAAPYITSTNSRISKKFIAFVNAKFWDTKVHPFPASTIRYVMSPLSEFDMDRISQRVGTEIRSYTIWNRSIELGEIPTAEDVGKYVEIRGYVEPELLTASGSTSVYDAAWDDILVVGGAYRLCRDLGQFDRAAELRNEYGKLIQDVVNYEMVEAENDEIRFTVETSDSMGAM